nr:hypothetical protein L203_01592 [Cryptococcus depauperatus CBS 7841]
METSDSSELSSIPSSSPAAARKRIAAGTSSVAPKKVKCKRQRKSTVNTKAVKSVSNNEKDERKLQKTLLKPHRIANEKKGKILASNALQEVKRKAEKGAEGNSKPSKRLKCLSSSSSSSHFYKKGHHTAAYREKSNEGSFGDFSISLAVSASTDDDPEKQTLDALIDFMQGTPEKSCLDSEEEDDSDEGSDTNPEDDQDFRPTPLPNGLLPETFVFAKYPSGYFISQFLSYQPAQNLRDQKAGKDYCTIMDANGKVHDKIKLEFIITKDDEKIADCKLGKYKIVDHSSPGFSTDADVRPPSPEFIHQQSIDSPANCIILPTPSPTQPPNTLTPADFCDLDRVSQLRLIRPHLHKILEEKYPPAQWRIDKFFENNQSRRNLNHEVSYGDIVGNEVIGIIIPELWRWTLRKDRRTTDVHSQQRLEEPPRPRGTQRYNELSIPKLKEYIDNVLLPEAIIELCIRSYYPMDLLKEIDNKQGGEGEEDIELLADVSDPELDTSLDFESEDEPQSNSQPLASKPKAKVELTPPPISLALHPTDPNQQKKFSPSHSPASLSSALSSVPTSPLSQYSPDSRLKHPVPFPVATDINNPVFDTKVSIFQPLQTASTSGSTWPDDETLYDAARILLRILSNRDISLMWSNGEFFLRLARETKRKELGLPPENVTPEELEEWKKEKALEEERSGNGRKKIQRVRSFKDME